MLELNIAGSFYGIKSDEDWQELERSLRQLHKVYADGAKPLHG